MHSKLTVGVYIPSLLYIAVQEDVNGKIGRERERERRSLRVAFNTGNRRRVAVRAPDASSALSGASKRSMVSKFHIIFQ